MNQPFAVVPALHSVYFIIHIKCRLAIASPLLEILQEEPVCFIYALRGPLHSKSFFFLLLKVAYAGWHN